MDRNNTIADWHLSSNRADPGNSIVAHPSPAYPCIGCGFESTSVCLFRPHDNPSLLVRYFLCDKCAETVATPGDAAVALLAALEAKAFQALNTFMRKLPVGGTA